MKRLLIWILCLLAVVAHSQPVTQYLVALTGATPAIAPVTQSLYQSVTLDCDNGYSRTTDLTLFGSPPYVLLDATNMQPGTNRVYLVARDPSGVVRMTTLASFTGAGFEMTCTNGVVQWLSTASLRPPIQWETNMADSPYIDRFAPGIVYWRLAAGVHLAWFINSLPTAYDTNDLDSSTNSILPPP